MKTLIPFIVCFWAGAAWGQQYQYTDEQLKQADERNKQIWLQERQKEQDDSAEKIRIAEYCKQQNALAEERRHEQDSVNAIWNKRVEAEVEKQNADAAREERKLYKKYGKAAIDKVKNGQVWVGITDELCLYGLTEPNSRKTTYTKAGKTEVWIYEGQASGCIGDGCPNLDYIITFKNHIAVAITTDD